MTESINSPGKCLSQVKGQVRETFFTDVYRTRLFADIEKDFVLFLYIFLMFAIYSYCLQFIFYSVTAGVELLEFRCTRAMTIK